MSWQILYISNPAVLTLKNKQLKYQSLETEEVLTFPIEDVSVIVLENHQVTLTHALLSACMEGKIVIFTCDERHIPNGALFPFAAHSRYALHSKTQLSASEPLKKKIWQQIIRQKIFNQATVLAFYDKKEAIRMASDFYDFLRDGTHVFGFFGSSYKRKCHLCQ